MIAKKHNAFNSLSVVFAIAFFFASLSYTPIFAQESVLKKKAKITKDTDKVICDCNRIITKTERELLEYEDSIQIFRAINRFKESPFQSCKVEGLILEFRYYCSEKKLDKALTLIKEQEQILKNTNCKDYFTYNLYLNKTLYYRASENLEKLSEFAFKALKESEFLKDSEKEIEIIKEVVYLFTRMQESDKNWDYIKRVETLIDEKAHPIELTKHFRWLGYEYEATYTRTGRKTLIDSGLVYIKRAKESALKYKIDYELALIYRALEAFSYHKKNPRVALKHIDSAIYYGKRIKGVKNLSGMYNSKAWDHLDLKQYEEAVKWMDTALYHDNKTLRGGGTAANMMLHHDAADLFESAGNIEKAYNSFRIHSKMKDSILNRDKIKMVNELETKYKTELKDAEIENLNQQQQIDALEIKNKRSQIYWLIVLVALISLIGIIIFFIYQQRSLKNKMRLITTEQRLNRARINPHFFFNAMASLQSFANKENSPKTSAFLSRFAKIMRQSLESTYTELVTIEKEIEFVIQYLETQKLLFPDKFDYKIEYEDTLEINELKMPGMLMQPFLENSIEHGFKNIDYKGKMVVNLKESPNEICITIRDNGMNLNENTPTKKHTSRAIQIVRDRLVLFNQQQKYNARFEILNLKEMKGFEIVIYLPKLY
ncbi:sensor histidine kinase [Flavivirga spongiicola]|uniref:Histidine kinase n=1 Tax=Flavivirga spongiicola TaxID=421621 RepID=A0ABU7XMN7_9FLAO|nr:histidine kinase [Flavivirga sp. MEBiC05379]MDO5981367.1 histidine kinase [Flavivirga sp. MEBiC05379]